MVSPISCHLSLARAVNKLYHNHSDTTVLNIALSGEHFDNAFYHQALEKFDEQAFLDAGFPSWVRGRFQQIADHEATHVQVLSAALGDWAMQPCTYNLCARFL